MYQRLLNLSKNKSFFLFGARGTGKTTLLASNFPPEVAFVIDLLNYDWFEKLSLRPQLLAEIVASLPTSVEFVIIDEIQKIPPLLDVVHSLIHSTSRKYILTGSSAKKLRHGGANLLAGRAFVYSLFPLTSFELGSHFQLSKALQFGTLPEVWNLGDPQEILLYLQAYSQIYLKEEIWSEQLVRKLVPFRRFLEVAAQSNAKILNVANIARNVGVDDKTVAAYNQILEDTLIGFFLEPFHHSFRKRLTQKPKFYFFDLGVVRTLNNQVSLPLVEQTSSFGDAFEHFVISEVHRLKHYLQPFFRLSYLQTQNDIEVDLIVERPGLPLLLIEIKSAPMVPDRALNSLQKIMKDLGEPCEGWVLCREPIARTVAAVRVLPWQEGLKELFSTT